MELVIDIHEHGAVEAMHSEEFSLNFLGKQEIKRASDIRFNTDTQLWGIWVADYMESDEPVFRTPIEAWEGFSSYKDAVDFEVLALNTLREANLSPFSTEGIHLAEKLRGS